jgi:hypothetical protein
MHPAPQRPFVTERSAPHARGQSMQFAIKKHALPFNKIPASQYEVRNRTRDHLAGTGRSMDELAAAGIDNPYGSHWNRRIVFKENQVAFLQIARSR